MNSSSSVSPVRRLARWWQRRGLARARRRTADPMAANAALNAAEIRHGRTRLVSTPLTIQAMTTLVCNLRCPFCRREEPAYRAHIDGLDADGRHMSWEIVERLLAVAPHATHFTLTPLGEPTLHRDFGRLLDRCRAIGLRNLDMTTNAAHLPDAMCEQIVRSGFHLVYLSIDSSDPATFAAMRVGTTLTEVEAGIERLSDWKRRLGSATPTLRIAATFERRNIEHLPDLVDFAARHAVAAVIVQRMDVGELVDPQWDLTEHPEITHRAIDEAQRRAARHGIELRLHFALANVTEPTDGAATRLTDLCTHPWHFAVVDIDGDVRPCCWADICLGNLRETPDFDAIWNGETARAMRADFLAGRLPAGCVGKHCGVSARWEQISAAASPSPPPRPRASVPPSA